MNADREPSFGELLRSNLRVLALLLVYVAVAYGIWRLLLVVFPDVGWLRIPER